MMVPKLFALVAAFIALSLMVTEHAATVSAFAPAKLATSPLKTLHCRYKMTPKPLASTPDDNSNLGVIDLTDDDDDDVPKTAPQSARTPTAPFLSQGELSDDPNLLSPDLSDAKQTRVIIYIILTLLPVLFLVPLMIGSRDLIPLDALPPVEIGN